MNANICIIHTYWGSLPPWFPHFIMSCKYNRDIDFMVFTDVVQENKREENVQYYPFSITDFNKLSSRKLELNITIDDPYRVCDLKPAFGHIFEDYLQGYAFWGYCDNDLIFGDIRKFVTGDILDKYDIISTSI